MTYERMKQVQTQIEKELDDAHEYAKLANELKGSDKRFADCYFEMAKHEIAHVNVLHGMVTQSLRDMEGDENSEKMKVIYAFLHDRLIDKSAQVNMMIQMYSEK